MMTRAADRRRRPGRTRPRSVGLFTYSTLPRGSVVHAACLADALCDAGWNATLYALDKDGRGFFRPLRAELQLVPAAAAPPSTAGLVRMRARELADHLNRNRRAHDIHHAEDCLSASGLLAAREGGLDVDLVRTVHHVERFEDARLDECQTRSIREASLCLAVSEAGRRDVKRIFQTDSVVVGNGVDTTRFRHADGERVARWRARLGSKAPLILAMGGVEPRKNTRGILEGFARLRAHHANAQLWIVGGATVLDHGAYRQQFDEALVAVGHDIADAVVELGVVSESDVPALFAVADLLAMPSMHEGFGLCALEALAAGLPAVVSERPPFTEFLDPSNATFVDPLSPSSIADGMMRALSASPSQRAAGLRRADSFSWGRVAERHIDQYERTWAHARNAFHRSLA